MTEERLISIREKGFDKSFASDEDGAIVVRCSACDALVINGVPCHERGCPNKPVVCRECGGLGHTDCRWGDDDLDKGETAWGERV